MEMVDKIILEHSLNPFVQQLTVDTDLLDDLEMDSLGLVDIVVCIEDELGISFPDDFLILDNLRSYVRIVEKVQEIVAGGPKSV